MKSIFTIIILALSILIISCKKGTDTPSTNNAQLTILTPGEAAVFNKNDTVRITATATNTTNMHGYEIIIHPVNDTTAIYRTAAHTHALTFNISEKWVNTSPAVKAQTVEVKVFTDHDGGYISQKRNITCN